MYYWQNSQFKTETDSRDKRINILENQLMLLSAASAPSAPETASPSPSPVASASPTASPTASSTATRYRGYYDATLGVQFDKTEDVLVTGAYSAEGLPNVTYTLYKTDSAFGYSPLNTTISVTRYPANNTDSPTNADLKRTAQADTTNTNFTNLTVSGVPAFSYDTGGMCSGKTTEFWKGQLRVKVKEYCTTDVAYYNRVLSTLVLP